MNDQRLNILKTNMGDQALKFFDNLHQQISTVTCCVGIDTRDDMSYNTSTCNNNKNSSRSNSDNNYNNNNNHRNKIFTSDVQNTNCSNITTATAAPVAEQLVVDVVEQQQQQQQQQQEHHQQQNPPVQQPGRAAASAVDGDGTSDQRTGISIISTQNMAYNMNQSYTSQYQGGSPQGYPPYQGQPPQGYPPYQGQPPQGYPPYQGQPPQGYPPYQGVPPQGYPPYQGGPPPGYSPPPLTTGYPQGYNASAIEAPVYVEGTIIIDKFERPEDRVKFIRGVYSILLLQLLFFFGVVLLMVFNEPLRERLSNPILLWISTGLYLVTTITAFCCFPHKMLTTNPFSVGTLIIITFALSLLSGSIAGRINPKIVLLAIGLTLGITLVLTIIAFTCRYDFTKWSGIMCVALVILMLFGIVTAFLKDLFPILDLIYAYLGAGIFCIYIIIDTQMLMAGKSVSLEPTMYVFGAIMLFVDVVMLFMHILKILNNGNSD